MGYIALGVVAFAIAVFFDLAALRGWRYLKQAIGLVALLLWGYAFCGLLRTSPRFRLPAPLTWLGWPLLFVSLFLLFYSLFLEIPFRQTYVTDGVGDKLVKAGTYALVRHPGVLWFAFFLASLVLVSRARLAPYRRTGMALHGRAVRLGSGAFLFHENVPRLRAIPARNAHADPQWGEHCSMR